MTVHVTHSQHYIAFLATTGSAMADHDCLAILTDAIEAGPDTAEWRNRDERLWDVTNNIYRCGPARYEIRLLAEVTTVATPRQFLGA